MENMLKLNKFIRRNYLTYKMEYKTNLVKTINKLNSKFI